MVSTSVNQSSINPSCINAPYIKSPIKHSLLGDEWITKMLSDAVCACVRACVRACVCASVRVCLTRLGPSSERGIPEETDLCQPEEESKSAN